MSSDRTEWQVVVESRDGAYVEVVTASWDRTKREMASALPAWLAHRRAAQMPTLVERMAHRDIHGRVMQP